MRYRRFGWVLLAGVLGGCSLVSVGGPPRSPAPVPSDSTSVGIRPPERRTRARPPLRFDEVRGVWVVRMTLYTPEGVRDMVERAHAGGINTLLVQVRGRGDALYASRWEPPPEGLADSLSFDPLALVIREAHARGMAVHAWVNTHLVWSGPTPPVSPEHMVNAHPAWLSVPRALAKDLWDMDPHDPAYVDALLQYAVEDTARAEGIFSSPSNPAVQARIYDIWMDVAEGYDLDGIHFDYVRFPAWNYDYSRSALDLFRRWVRERLEPERFAELEEGYQGGDPFSFTDALPDAWNEFRREAVTALVERVYHGVKARKPDLLVSAAVRADSTDAYKSRFQDWRRWLDEGVVDVVVPMAYTARDELFRTQIRDARRAAGGRDRIWAGVGAYLNGLEGTLEKIDIARREGVGGLILFSYDWAVTEGTPEGSEPFLELVGRAKFGGN